VPRLLPVGILLALLAVASGTYAAAQTIEASTAALQRAKDEARRANERSAEFERQAARANSDAARARAAQAAVAARIQSAEQDIAAAQARIAIVEQLRMRQRARLAAQQQPIVRLAGALQTMAQRPPALALVQRGSIDDLVHVRALLGAQLPIIRARTVGLRAEVARGTRLAAQAKAAADTLSQGRRRLEAERAQLARLEASQLIRRQAMIDSAEHETDRSLALGEDARDIVDLMDRLETQAAVGDRLAALPGPTLRPQIPGLAPLPRPERGRAGRQTLAYRLPVVGRIVTGLGEVSGAGVKSRGLTLLAAPGAQVVAPAAGRIAYAGAFRGYGRIVIVDHGGGWTSLVTALDTLSVRVGDGVDRGSPLGRTAGHRSNVTVELRRDGQAVDITPLLTG